MSGRRYDLRTRSPKMKQTLNNSRVTRSMTTSSSAVKRLRVFENGVQNAATQSEIYDEKYSRILKNVPENEKLERHLVCAITDNKVIPTPVVETLDEKEYEDLYGVAFDGMPEILMTEGDRRKNSTVGDPLPEATEMKFTPPASKPCTILLKKLNLNKWVENQNCSHFRVVRDENFYSVVPYHLSVDAKMLRVNDK